MKLMEKRPAVYLAVAMAGLLSVLATEIVLLYRSRPVIRIIRTLILTAWLSVYAGEASAFLYGEHKLIGDRAFALAMRYLDGEARAAVLRRYLGGISPADGDAFKFPGLSAPGAPYAVTYGLLNGLSGDHESDPAMLELLLKEPGSRIGRIILLHQSYLDQGLKAAPDGELVRADLNYAIQAAVNLAHFYAYGRSFAGQLRDLDPGSIKGAVTEAGLTRLTKALAHGNAILMYASLHLLAMDLAEKAGKQAAPDPEGTKQLLQRALLLNAFADHFLEDAFSAGHLVVNRSVLASLTNNKALHDFYCEQGTMVVNRKGEIWRAYGDGYLDADTETGRRIIAAVQLSVEEVFNAFIEAHENPARTMTLDRLPVASAARPGYLISTLAALQLVPVPYNSDLGTVMPAHIRLTDTMQRTNQLLYYRNFIRSRVGNSLVIGQLNTVFRDVQVTGYELRVNALNFSKHYAYNPAGGKKGMLDTWHSYTLAYQLTRSHENRPGIFRTQFTGGLRSNFDYWLNDTRFLGLYTYLEGGLRFEDHRADGVFAPAVGINLGSLFQVNYYNMPGWLRIPVMYLLPLKVRYQTVFTFRRPPEQQTGLELDLFF